MQHTCIECNRKTIASFGGFCWSCYEMDTRIKRQNKYARKAGLQHDLTLTQWRKTFAYFKGACAYCGKRPTKLYDSLFIEHFIPIASGESGTTVSNCVPACVSCNTKKRNLHPSQVTSIPHENMEKVRVFLEKQK